MTYLEICVYDNEVVSFFPQLREETFLMYETKKNYSNLEFLFHVMCIHISLNSPIFAFKAISFFFFLETAIILLPYDKKLSLQSHEFQLVYNIWIATVFSTLISVFWQYGHFLFTIFYFRIKH